jgi:hypothetical protein
VNVNGIGVGRTRVKGVKKAFATMGDDPVFMKTKVLDALTCPVCENYFKGVVYNCSKGHSVCSLCYSGSDKTCNWGTGPEHTFPNNYCINYIVSGLVDDLGLPVPCKNLKSGCGHTEVQKMIREHESECRFKKVQCLFIGCKKVMFKDVLDHLKVKHECVPDGKWSLNMKNNDAESRHAVRFWSEPNGGETFIVCLLKDSNDVWTSIVRVIGGARAAQKYRSEIRLGSSDTDDSLTYNGPVLDIDAEWSANVGVHVVEAIFVKYNQGKDHFGPHNVDKLGNICSHHS